MKGVIEDMYVNTSKNGNDYLTLIIGGEKYFLWDEKYFDGLEVGKEINYQWSQNGKFKRITEIDYNHEPSQEPAQKVEPLPIDRKTLQMVRMSSLKSASVILQNAQLAPEEKSELTLDLARKFEKYIIEDNHDEEGV